MVQTSYVAPIPGQIDEPSYLTLIPEQVVQLLPASRPRERKEPLYALRPREMAKPWSAPKPRPMAQSLFALRPKDMSAPSSSSPLKNEITQDDPRDIEVYNEWSVPAEGLGEDLARNCEIARALFKATDNRDCSFALKYKNPPTCHRYH